MLRMQTVIKSKSEHCADGNRIQNQTFSHTFNRGMYFEIHLTEQCFLKNNAVYADCYECRR